MALLKRDSGKLFTSEIVKYLRTPILQNISKSLLLGSRIDPVLTHFFPSGLFFPLKISEENLWFTDVFKGTERGQWQEMG